MKENFTKGSTDQPRSHYAAIFLGKTGPRYAPQKRSVGAGTQNPEGRDFHDGGISRSDNQKGDSATAAGTIDLLNSSSDSDSSSSTDDSSSFGDSQSSSESGSSSTFSSSDSGSCSSPSSSCGPK
jgi:hypothetical protein